MPPRLIPMLKHIYWISVTRAAPTTPVEVLVFDDEIAQVTTGYFDGERWRIYQDEEDIDITYWAFLPPPPD